MAGLAEDGCIDRIMARDLQAPEWIPLDQGELPIQASLDSFRSTLSWPPYATFKNILELSTFRIDGINARRALLGFSEAGLVRPKRKGDFVKINSHENSLTLYLPTLRTLQEKTTSRPIGAV